MRVAGLRNEYRRHEDTHLHTITLADEDRPDGGREAVRLLGSTAGDFLRAGACAVAVGGELVDAQTIKEGKYEVFEARAAQYLEVVRKTRAEMGSKAAAK